ncbi:NTP transferase domain-containing protein [Kitasatospora sp. NPDC036755]|uniref:NTP transferase domain-containing protein n=1 Tax=Kitasatospora sp. NPDC036755 TaxID=3154600 RepID=UPI00340FC12F
MTERSTTETPAPYYSSTLVSLPTRAVALLLAGGKGSRMRDAPDAELRRTPKVLVPIDTDAGRTPMLGHALAQLTVAGFRRIAVLTSTHPVAGAEAVETYALTHPCARQVELTIHREQNPLGTAGPPPAPGPAPSRMVREAKHPSPHGRWGSTGGSCQG